MKIVFWSPTAGSGNVSSTAALCAAFTSLKYDVNCSIIPLNVGNRGAQNAFMDSDADKALNSTLGSFGIDALLLSVTGGFATVEDIKNVSLSVLNKLSYFAASTSQRIETTKLNILKEYDKLVENLERAYDYNFIDIGSGVSDITEQAIGSADVLVICLQQNKDSVQTLFQSVDISELPCVYLLTDYDPKVSFNIKNFAKGMPYCKGSLASVIPHNSDYANALNDSQLLRFLSANMQEDKLGLAQKLGFAKSNETQYFFSSVKDAVNKILKLGGADIELV